ncbi:uncharacterized protein LOC114439421 isoform X2 [Parambassis ranga]|uniref:Uncharacterized protein LOC114439421 isoform X2 n=1 Tax=Parambassis ranga TaxID=210632 RepID=A0A6P7IQ29_9TELE|nr:uncharacterized protein LOC114439421 isoform X2 [Parambassis ranga]
MCLVISHNSSRRGSYGIPGMYSLAVRIPLSNNQNQNINLQQVLKSDPPERVKDEINKDNVDNVYIGTRVVAAKVLKWEEGAAKAAHAESRVVDHLDHLFRESKNIDDDLVLFYVYASPCVEKCSAEKHPENILKRINHILQWKNYSFVFSKIFKPKNGKINTDQERKDALQKLATYKGEFGSIGLNNIFRCDGERGKMQCVSCSTSGQVTPFCYSDDTQPVPRQNRGWRGRERSRSRSVERPKNRGWRGRERSKSRSVGKSRSRGWGGTRRSRSRSVERPKNRGWGGRERSRSRSVERPKNRGWGGRERSRSRSVERPKNRGWGGRERSRSRSVERPKNRGWGGRERSRSVERPKNTGWRGRERSRSVERPKNTGWRGRERSRSRSVGKSRSRGWGGRKFRAEI